MAAAERGRSPARRGRRDGSGTAGSGPGRGRGDRAARSGSCAHPARRQPVCPRPAAGISHPAGQTSAGHSVHPHEFSLIGQGQDRAGGRSSPNRDGRPRDVSPARSGAGIAHPSACPGWQPQFPGLQPRQLYPGLAGTRPAGGATALRRSGQRSHGSRVRHPGRGADSHPVPAGGQQGGPGHGSTALDQRHPGPDPPTHRRLALPGCRSAPASGQGLGSPGSVWVLAGGWRVGRGDRPLCPIALASG